MSGPSSSNTPQPEDQNELSAPDFDLIHSYSRAQGIADGVLIDVTETAKEAGFVIPVALTAAVFAEYVKVPESVEGQDEKGRLWDILTVLRHEIKSSRAAGPELLFKVHVRNDNSEGEPPLVTLKSLIWPGDAGEMTLTVMLPEGED